MSFSASHRLLRSHAGRGAAPVLAALALCGIFNAPADAQILYGITDSGNLYEVNPVARYSA